jgi:hypothetical protein
LSQRLEVVIAQCSLIQGELTAALFGNISGWYSTAMKILEIVGLVLAVCLYSLLDSRVEAQLGGPKPVGGWTDYKSNDETVQNLTKWAVDEMQRRINAVYCTRLLRIVKVETQVVSGVNYRIVLHQGYTLHPVPSGRSCQSDPKVALAPTTKEEKCTVVVWYRAWMKYQQEGTQLTSQDCRASRAV